MIAEKIDLEDIGRSNSISALGYNPAKQIAALRFVSGDTWHYAGVPLDVFTAWYAAESIGRFYVDHIRGKYHGEKMTGGCSDCGDRGWIGERCADCGCSDYAADLRPVKGGTDGAAGSL